MWGCKRRFNRQCQIVSELAKKLAKVRSYFRSELIDRVKVTISFIFRGSEKDLFPMIKNSGAKSAWKNQIWRRSWEKKVSSNRGKDSLQILYSVLYFILKIKFYNGFRGHVYIWIGSYASKRSSFMCLNQIEEKSRFYWKVERVKF